MNFKLVALITLIGVGLTVRGDYPCCPINDGRIEIVSTKNVTSQELAQELIDMKSAWDARQVLNRLSFEDRKEVRNALQEKLLLWVVEHGSIDSIRMQYTCINEKRPSYLQEILAVESACIATMFSLIGFWDVFARAYGCTEAVSVMGKDFGKFVNFAPNKISATVALTGAAVGFAGFGVLNYFRDNVKALNKESSALDDKMKELRSIQELLEYCA